MELIGHDAIEQNLVDINKLLSILAKVRRDLGLDLWDSKDTLIQKILNEYLPNPSKLREDIQQPAELRQRLKNRLLCGNVG